MRKNLVVFNGVDYPTHVVEFARKLAKDQGSVLRAVFTKPMHVSDNLQYPFPNDLSQTHEAVDEAAERRTDLQAVEDNKQVFKDECQADNITYSIDDDVEISLEQLVEHSKFSDLILADVNNELGKYSMDALLEKTHCPVILVQRQSEIPNRVILAYDGSESSIHAIKMYSYLFPEWRNLTTLLVQVNPESVGIITEEKYMRDWLASHFSSVNINVLQGEVDKELAGLLTNHSNKTMIVMGAYGKKGIAGLFHQSLSKNVIEASYGALFISHK